MPVKRTTVVSFIHDAYWEYVNGIADKIGEIGLPEFLKDPISYTNFSNKTKLQIYTDSKPGIERFFEKFFPKKGEAKPVVEKDPEQRVPDYKIDQELSENPLIAAFMALASKRKGFQEFLATNPEDLESGPKKSPKGQKDKEDLDDVILLKLRRKLVEEIDAKPEADFESTKRAILLDLLKADFEELKRHAIADAFVKKSPNSMNLSNLTTTSATSWKSESVDEFGRCKYKPERLEVHQEIIDELLKGKKEAAEGERKLIYIAGALGTEKGKLVDALKDGGIIEDDNTVVIDSSIFKRHLPGCLPFFSHPEKRPHMAEEYEDILFKIVEAATKKGLNIVVKDHGEFGLVDTYWDRIGGINLRIKDITDLTTQKGYENVYLALGTDKEHLEEKLDSRKKSGRIFDVEMSLQHVSDVASHWRDNVEKGYFSSSMYFAPDGRPIATFAGGATQIHNQSEYEGIYTQMAVSALHKVRSDAGSTWELAKSIGADERARIEGNAPRVFTEVPTDCTHTVSMTFSAVNKYVDSNHKPKEAPEVEVITPTIRERILARYYRGPS